MSSRLLNKVGKLLIAILTDRAQLPGFMQLYRQQWLVRVKLIELNEITIANRADDLAGAIVLMVSTVENQEHADDRICDSVRSRSFVAQIGLPFDPGPDWGSDGALSVCVH
jgi:hypothetical protein